MDPITHALAGSLLGKSYFDQRQGGAGIFAVTLGAVFPDVDTAARFITDDPLAIIRYHRGFTHSFIGLPVFALGLAGITRWWLRRRGHSSPTFWALSLAFAAGLASHIFLDAVTSYGTCVLNPLSSVRVSWDLLFIVDFLFTGMLVASQLASWIYREPAKTLRRALILFLLGVIATLGIWRLAAVAGYPFRLRSGIVIMLLLGAIFFLPHLNGWGWRTPRRKWCRAGVYVACGYLLTSYGAHQAALSRVHTFAAHTHEKVLRSAAIPLPPSLLSWDGMILTGAGVWKSQFTLLDAPPSQWIFFASSPPDDVLEQALQVKEVQTYLWFARFPVIRTSQEDGRGIVDFLDVRFPRRQEQQVRPFTYRVILDPEGHLIEDDWVVGASGVHLRRHVAAGHEPSQ
jgi:membrane-bound metal-dependent hydrolase YbcI (DUF457 family)